MRPQELPRNDPDYDQPAESPLATAQWERSQDIINSYEITLDPKGCDSIPQGQLVDKHGQRHYIGIRDNRHMMLIAGSRGGKFTSQIANTLLHYIHNCVVIDPKAESVNVTAAFRQNLGHRIALLDPFLIADERLSSYRASYNPLSSLDKDDPEVIDDASGIADALIVKSKNAQDPHWEESARMVIRALILYVLIDERIEENGQTPTLFHVANLLSHGIIDPKDELDILQIHDPDKIAKHLRQAPRSFLNLVEVWKKITAFDGAISAVGHALADMGDREIGSVLSTARRQLDFIFSPAMKNVLSTTDIDPADLRDPNKPTTIYLVLPEYRMGTHNRWLRLMITTLMHSLQRDGVGMAGKPKTKTLFILDEFPTLDYLSVIERAASYIAGFGVQLFIVLQDLGQLRDLYNRRWETFIGNCGALISFANTDAATLDYLSKRLGETEIIKFETSTTLNEGGSSSKAGLGERIKQYSSEAGVPEALLGASSQQENYSLGKTTAPKFQTTPLMRPDEIARYFARKPEGHEAEETALVMVAGSRPWRLSKCFYYNDPILKERVKHA